MKDEIEIIRNTENISLFRNMLKKREVRISVKISGIWIINGAFTIRFLKTCLREKGMVH